MNNRNFVQDLSCNSQSPNAFTGRGRRAGAIRTALFGGLLLVLGAGASCAGPKYQVNDVVLSDLPLQDKERMLVVQGEMNQATEEKNKAMADLAIDARDIDVAQAEHAQARLEADKLEAEVRLAERGQDLNRIRPAKARLSELNNTRSLSDAKLNWLQHRRDYHHTLVEVADLHGMAAKSRYELEKARLAQSSGKLPNKNFKVAQFEGQEARAQQKYEEARARANKQMMETGQLEQAYSQISSSRPSS